MTLSIIGLGPGDVDYLSCKAWHTLEKARTVYLHTAQHNSVLHLPKEGTTYHNFDDLYHSGDDLEVIYGQIIERLLDAAKDDDIVYAVPGDPLVDGMITKRVMERAGQLNIDVHIVNGISFIEPALALLDVDVRDGLQMVDGIAVAVMYHPPINPDKAALIGQVNKNNITDIKKTLLNQYSADFQVKLVHGAGTVKGRVESLPLGEIDGKNIGTTTMLYVPALGEMTSFEQFQEIIAHLRAPDGCPWDRRQTHESLRQYLLEEAYEVLETIDDGDTEALAEELGDLLLQVVLHTQIAIDNGTFQMSDVLRHINTKMVYRHPHVFGTVNVKDSDEVLLNWQALKTQEKANNGKSEESILDGVPKSLPALLRSYEYQHRAARVGFDWPVVDDVRAKFNEELDEVMEVLQEPEKLQDEIGDVLFVMVNWIRWLKIDPENALRDANNKFYRRFTYIEQRVRENGKEMTDYTLDELEGFWGEAKKKGL
jgi:tetrapyrrole methylase family protein / MazG family protein